MSLSDVSSSVALETPHIVPIDATFADSDYHSTAKPVGKFSIMHRKRTRTRNSEPNASMSDPSPSVALATPQVLLTLKLCVWTSIISEYSSKDGLAIFQKVYLYIFYLV